MNYRILGNDPGKPPRLVGILQAVHSAPSIVIAIAPTSLLLIVIGVLGSFAVQQWMGVVVIGLIGTSVFIYIVKHYKKILMYYDSVYATIIKVEPYGPFDGYISFARYYTINVEYYYNANKISSKWIVESKSMHGIIPKAGYKIWGVVDTSNPKRFVPWLY